MYDYKCKKCGHEFENLVPFSIEDKDVECPSCNNKDSKRLLCAPNISTDANVQVMHHQAFHEQTKSVVTVTFNDFLYKPRSPGVYCYWEDG